MIRILYIVLISLLYAHSFGQQWKWALDLKGASGGDVQTDATGNIYLLSAVDNSVYANTNYSLPCGECGAVIARHDASGNVIWARGLGLWSYPSHFSLDKMGNIYIAGCYQYTNTFCGGNNPNVTLVHANGLSDAFICKYDSHGNLLWVNSWTDVNSSDGASAIKTDYDGNSYVTGISWSYPLQSTSNFFLRKFNSQGNLIWATDANWKGNMGATSIDIDNNDNCYITGMFEDTAYFQNIKFKSNSPSTIFIAKYDSSGNVIWAKKVGTNYDDCNKLKMDNSSKYFYIAGDNGNPSVFGNTTVTVGGMFLAKCDTSGAFVWIRSAVTGQCYDVAIDTSNSPVMTGFFQNGNAIFGSGNNTVVLTSQKQREVFAAKFDKSGLFKWAIAPGGSSGNEETAYSIACDLNGNCYITGNCNNTTTFGSNTLVVQQVNGSSSHIFLAKIQDTVAIITGIKKNDADNLDFTIFPNPTENMFNISCSLCGNEEITINIYNSNGEKIFSKLCSSNEDIFKNQISLEKFARGLYLIDIRSERIRAIKMIVLN